MLHLPYKFDVGDLLRRTKMDNSYEVGYCDKVLIVGHGLIHSGYVDWHTYTVLDINTGSITEMIVGSIENFYKKAT